jgi:glycosyltransferase involved in cell wall biosynthesis
MKEKHIPYKPLVSLVITTYNRAIFLRKAIESARAQNYENLEIIISDNCSSDGTKEIVGEYADDRRVKYSINSENIGMLPNFLKATSELAMGEFITYLSSDDYLINDEFISQAIELIAQRRTVNIVHSINISHILATCESFLDYSYIYYKNSFYKDCIISGIEVFGKFPKCHSVSFGGTLFNRKQLLSCSPFSDSRILSGDTQLILQLLLLGDAAFLEQNTYVVQRHGSNATSTVSNAQAYIDNFGYIEKPYKFALEQNTIEEKWLSNWREDMYRNYSAQCLLNLYKVNKIQYKVFKDYLVEKHPLVYRNITRKTTWMIFSAIYYNDFTSTIYSLLALWYRKLKSKLSGHKSFTHSVSGRKCI